MKKIINISRIMVLLGVLFMVAVSCNKSEDLVTEDAMTGGLVVPTAAFFYKLGVTAAADIVIIIPPGPQINEIYVYNKYIANDTTESNEVLMKTITGFGNQYTMSLTYADLREGLIVNGQPMPTSDTALAIGSQFILRYEVKMGDGRRLLNVNETSVGISNFFAGKYLATGVFHHPVAGDRALNAEKDLVALNAFECWTSVADLGGAGYFMKININPATNVATVYSYAGTTPLFMTPGMDSFYDPVTGVIQLYYYYVGGTGNRVIEEKFTPSGK